MSKFRIACLMLALCWATPAVAQVSIGIGLPIVNIGINLPVYPQLVPVPGYPVYYAPDVNSNYFFYDGLYWVYRGNSWYASSWYNGPWGIVDPGYVPVHVLRIPVRYYRKPPRHFRHWKSNEPPHWGHEWGNDWSERRRGWDQWSHKSYNPAPLPTYQKEYSGDRYPRVDKQPTLHREKYRYHPKNRVVRETYRAQGIQAPAEADRRDDKGAKHESKASSQGKKQKSSGKQDRGRPQGGGGGDHGRGNGHGRGN